MYIHICPFKCPGSRYIAQLWESVHSELDTVLYSVDRPVYKYTHTLEIARTILHRYTYVFIRVHPVIHGVIKHNACRQSTYQVNIE